MKYPASHLTPFLSTFPPKNTCKRMQKRENSFVASCLRCPPLFSASYESLPIPARFRNHLFSCTYKSLFAQPLYFHIYTKPPGVIPLAFSFRLSTPSPERPTRRRDLFNPTSLQRGKATLR